jgi:hypothetical protein
MACNRPQKLIRPDVADGALLLDRLAGRHHRAHGRDCGGLGDVRRRKMDHQSLVTYRGGGRALLRRRHGRI